MEPIIEPIPVQLIEQELTADRLLRHTNKADNDIYVINAHNAPNTMREIGRLREISFRSAGGGTGKACDIDEFDTMPVPCQQLLVWNPDKREIIGAYRFIGGWDVDVIDGVPHIARQAGNHRSLPFHRRLGRGRHRRRATHCHGPHVPLQ